MDLMAGAAAHYGTASDLLYEYHRSASHKSPWMKEMIWGFVPLPGKRYGWMVSLTWDVPRKLQKRLERSDAPTASVDGPVYILWEEVGVGARLDFYCYVVGAFLDSAEAEEAATEFIHDTDSKVACYEWARIVEVGTRPGEMKPCEKGQGFWRRVFSTQRQGDEIVTEYDTAGGETEGEE